MINKNIILGFALGVVANLIASYIWDRTTHENK